jgi:hypothetical protein
VLDIVPVMINPAISTHHPKTLVLPAGNHWIKKAYVQSVRQPDAGKAEEDAG